MRYRILILVFLCCIAVIASAYILRQSGSCCCSGSSCVLPVKTAHFSESMKINNFPQFTENQGTRQLLTLFEKVYERNCPENVPVQSDAKIPKYLHTVWFGGKMPEEYEPYYQTWRDYHPDWTFIFWTDNPVNYCKGDVVYTSFEQVAQHLATHKEPTRIVVDTSNLIYDNKQFYDKATNYGERSDIIKWEVVYRFGGVYVDTDFECLQSLDTLHHMYDFYTGLQPLDTSTVQLGAALFAAVPGHPVMRACVEDIKDNQHIAQIIRKTGPLHFTRCFVMNACRDNRLDVAFPGSYFYPQGYFEQHLPREQWNRPESMAIHHWAGSWLKKEAFVNA